MRYLLIVLSVFIAANYIYIIYIYYMQDTNIDRFSNRNIDQICLYQLS